MRFFISGKSAETSLFSEEFCRKAQKDFPFASSFAVGLK